MHLHPYNLLVSTLMLACAGSVFLGARVMERRRDGAGHEYGRSLGYVSIALLVALGCVIIFHH